MVDDDSGGGVHPVPRGEAEGEHGPAGGVRPDEAGQPVGEVAREGRPAGEAARGPAGDGGVGPRRPEGVRLAVLGDDPAAQVHQRDGGVRDGDVGPGDQIAAGVDLDGDVGTAEPLGPGGPRALPDESARQQLPDVAGHRRRGEAGEPGDVGPGDGPVVEDRAQHGTGAGHPAGGACRRDVRAAQRDRAADGHGRRLHRCLHRSSMAAGRAGRRPDGPRTRSVRRRAGGGFGFSRGTVPRGAHGRGLRRRSRRGRSRSGPATRRGAHTLQVDVTSRRQVCGSLHGAQRSRNGGTRSNR